MHFVKSRDNRVFTGILGGLAAYFGVSPRLLRICFFMLTYFFNWLLLIYIFLMFAMPEENDEYEEAGSFIAEINLPQPLKKVLSRFYSSLNEACSVLFKN